jgi:hypothetical protein
MSAVDIVVPCYNYGRYLHKCVMSALNQEGVDVRVLIIDDCSRDDTAEVGIGLAAQDSRVEFRRHAVNRGHIATYNEGLLEWAGGDYCLLLSADDLLAPGALLRAATVMDQHPEVGMTYGQAVVTEFPDAASYTPPEAWSVEVVSGSEYIRRSCEAGKNLVWTPTAVVRTTVQHRVGGYRPELPHAGDMDMWLRCAAHASVGILDCQQAYYRLHNTQMCKTFPGLPDVQQRKAVFDLLVTESASLIPEAPTLHRLAMKTLSSQSISLAHMALARGDGLACRQLVQFAREISPSDYSWSDWAKLRFKQLLGPRLSQLLWQARTALQMRPRCA